MAGYVNTLYRSHMARTSLQTSQMASIVIIVRPDELEYKGCRDASRGRLLLLGVKSQADKVLNA